MNIFNKLDPNEVIIKTQKELDAIPLDYKGIIKITGGVSYNRIVVKNCYHYHVEAWGNSNVEAWENSNVEAWGNSNVVAWENSNVEARENSNVVARGKVGVHLQSDYATVALFLFSVCWKLAKGKITVKSKTATVIEPKYSKGTKGWFEKEGIEEKSKVIIYKKVSIDFKTQEKTKNETLWTIGTSLTHSSWEPTKEECGGGKFHGCSRPYFCDEFRNNKGDRYIAIEVNKKDLYAWENPSYPHKIAFKKGTVLHECNKFGKKI